MNKVITAMCYWLMVPLSGFAAPPRSAPTTGLPAAERPFVPKPAPAPTPASHATQAFLDLRYRESIEVGAARAIVQGVPRVAAMHFDDRLGEEQERFGAERYAALSAATSSVRTMGRLEAFADRFHHEGLPVARLWENHAALVSIGLNRRGKPGLWLTQKIP